MNNILTLFTNGIISYLLVASVVANRFRERDW